MQILLKQLQQDQFETPFESKAALPRSVHIMCVDDTVVPLDLSIEASQYFKSPKLKFVDGDHRIPTESETVKYIAKVLDNVWRRKYEGNACELLPD